MKKILLALPLSLIAIIACEKENTVETAENKVENEVQRSAGFENPHEWVGIENNTRAA